MDKGVGPTYAAGEIVSTAPNLCRRKPITVMRIAEPLIEATYIVGSIVFLVLASIRIKILESDIGEFSPEVYVDVMNLLAGTAICGGVSAIIVGIEKSCSKIVFESLSRSNIK